MTPLPDPETWLLRRRAGLLVTAVGLCWVVLAGRLIDLQVWHRAELSSRAGRQSEFIEEIPARPGDIFDAQGRLLATSVRVPSLYLVPIEIPDAAGIARQLAPILDLDPQELTDRLQAHADKHFLWVKRRLEDSRVEQIRQLKLPVGCWGVRDEFLRVYPQGILAAHVLGLRDIDGQGRGGIEESCHAELTGQPGRRRQLRDARGRVIDVIDMPEHPVQPGKDLHLTLDAVLQLYTERALDSLMSEWQPAACCAIVMHPQTGQVLSMASRPAYDPNHPETAPADAWKNRAISDIYEPGSTFKPIIVAHGLDQGLLTRDDVFNCEWGRYRMGRRLLHDHHPYGQLSLTDVLVKSSNIGMAKIGERLTNAELFRAATTFGFGRKTGIELPGELPGILRPLDQWTSYSTGSIPMGHELAATPLQLITAHAILANRGRLVRPKIISSSSNVLEVGALGGLVQKIVDEGAARWLVEEPMRQVVERGTGRRAKIEGYDVFGKTGTAQGLSPQGGYLHGKYISSFVCGAPAHDPQLIVLVVVNQAKGSGGETFGGRIAAPVASQILKEALNHRRIGPDSTPLVPPGRWAGRPVPGRS